MKKGNDYKKMLMKAKAKIKIKSILQLNLLSINLFLCLDYKISESLLSEIAINSFIISSSLDNLEFLMLSS